MYWRTFYRQVAMTKNIPFVHRNLNKKTIEAIQEIDDKENLMSYDSFSELRQDLEV